MVDAGIAGNGKHATKSLSEFDVRQSTYYSMLLKHLASVFFDQTTFTSLLREGRGAFPDIVVQLVELMGWGDKMPTGLVREESYDFDVELHPLLFEWYFNRPSARYIAEIAASFGTEWTCLGTPTIAHELSRHQGSVRLIDADPVVKRRFPSLAEIADLRIAEVGDQQPENLSRVAVIDPPWYLTDVLRWLALARRWVVDGGTIIAPIFPEMTRPSAWSEREQLLAAASSLGSVELHPKAAAYSTPGFEVESIRALGILDPGDWRVADLLVIRNTRGSISTPPSESARLADHGWATFIIDRQVVKVRDTVITSSISTGLEVGDSTALLPIDGCPNHTLTSVSERDERRHLVGIWTSRNRVARVLDVNTVKNWLADLSTPARRNALIESADSSGDLSLLLEILGMTKSR